MSMLYLDAHATCYVHALPLCACYITRNDTTCPFHLLESLAESNVKLEDPALAFHRKNVGHTEFEMLDACAITMVM